MTAPTPTPLPPAWRVVVLALDIHVLAERAGRGPDWPTAEQHMELYRTARSILEPHLKGLAATLAVHGLSLVYERPPIAVPEPTPSPTPTPTA